MEENKVLEVIDGGMVEDVYEEVTKSSNKNIPLKLGVGAVVVTTVGYGVYRLYKKVKNRKNETEHVDSECKVNNNNE